MVTLSPTPGVLRSLLTTMGSLRRDGPGSMVVPPLPSLAKHWHNGGPWTLYQPVIIVVLYCSEE